jgi:GMP synthase-like glutamine amidotransferase
MNIGLLGCDDVPDRFKHIAGGYREMFEKLLAPHVPGLELTWFDACSGKLPAAPDACDAFVCTGSRYSVYDDRDWIESLKQFVRDLHDARTPFVGICFGHPILAQALGGEVSPAAYGWGIGVHDMALVNAEPWIEPREAHCRLQYMHADQVQRMPEGSTLLASAPHCPVAMFRVGETMLGVEGHPEFPAAYEEALLRARRERIGAERVDAAIASLATPTDEKLAGRWIANFIERARTAR